MGKSSKLSSSAPVNRAFIVAPVKHAFIVLGSWMATLTYQLIWRTDLWPRDTSRMNPMIDPRTLNRTPIQNIWVLSSDGGASRPWMSVQSISRKPDFINFLHLNRNLSHWNSLSLAYEIITLLDLGPSKASFFRTLLMSIPLILRLCALKSWFRATPSRIKKCYWETPESIWLTTTKSETKYFHSNFGDHDVYNLLCLKKNEGNFQNHEKFTPNSDHWL